MYVLIYQALQWRVVWHRGSECRDCSEDTPTVTWDTGFGLGRFGRFGHVKSPWSTWYEFSKAPAECSRLSLGWAAAAAKHQLSISCHWLLVSRQRSVSDNSRWARHLFTGHCEHQISMVQQSGTGWDDVPQMNVLSEYSKTFFSFLFGFF